MRYRVLIALPLVWAAAFFAGELFFFGSPHYRTFLRIEIETVKFLALLGTWIAALKFERGAYLRRAWFLHGGCMFLLLVRDMTVLPLGFESLGLNLDLIRPVLALLANLSAVLGNWMLAPPSATRS